MVELGEICLKVTDGSHNPPKGSSKGLLMLSSRNISDEGLVLDNVRYITPEEFEFENKRTNIQPGDVLITIVGTIGRILVVNENHPKFTLQRSVGVLKPKMDIVNPKFLSYCLKSNDFQRKLFRGSRGVAQKGIYLKELRKLKIPLPPLPTQKKIAALLDEADQLRRLNQQILEKYDALTQAVFLEMFGDPVRNEKGWEKIVLEKLSKITSGSTPSRKNQDYYKGNIPWVKTGEVNGTLILDSEEKISKEALENSSCKLYPKGSIIIAMYGQGKTRGQIGILGIEATTNQACAVIPPSELMDFHYLFYLLKMSYENLRSLGRGGNQPNLSTGLLKKFEVINPPINYQTQFATRIQNIEQQKSLAQAALKKSEDLFNALLQQSFSGK